MYKIQLRRDRAREWTDKDPILDAGEAGFEIDTGRLKIGDGIATWNELPYFIPFDRSIDEIIGPEGPPGPPGLSIPGPPGPPGPPGQGTATEPITFGQGTPSKVWEFPNPFSYSPMVTTYNNDGEEVEGDVSFPSGLIRVEFYYPMTGTLRSR